MKIKSLIQAAPITGLAAVLLVATSANASVITYNTNAVGTGFVTSGMTLRSSSGAPATLKYTPDGDTTIGVASNVNFGNFTLACETCSTQAIGTGSLFESFTFNLIVTDVTDVASGRFVGSSTGGTVFSDVSPIEINWAPLQLGPGANNATSGTFGSTTFTNTLYTAIVAPNSGTISGQTTVEGHVDSNAVPEPSPAGLVGTAVLGVLLWCRKSFSQIYERHLY